MDDRTQQTYPSPATYPGAPELGAAPGPAPAVEPAPQVTLGSLLARLPRLLLIRATHLLIPVGQALRPRIGTLLLVLALLGVIGFQALALILPRIISPEADARTALIPPPAAVLSFIEGQRAYDIEQIWGALSPELQGILENNGVTKEAIAAQIEQERAAGQKYLRYNYIGGVDIADSRRMFFYAVDIQSPNPARNGTFSFVFTVDRSGKIVDLSM